MHKRIMYFMPDCPVGMDAGNKIHTLQLLEYFNSRHENISLDFVSERFWGKWKEGDEKLFKEAFPHCNLFILDRKLFKKQSMLKYIFAYKIPTYMKKHRWLIKKTALPDNNTNILQRSFNELLRQKKYDYIIISYVTWATLIKNNPLTNDAVIINDTHDFITAQLKDKKKFRLGESFEREMKLLSLFDETWSLSHDEKYLYSQFIPGAVHRFTPIMFENNYANRPGPASYKYDLIFVGSGNEHNIRSLNWFFNDVYPLLPKEISICVIGKIGNYISEFDNVEKVRFADSLDQYYHKAKVALCPMLSGTGVKVKVVEALSYGLPVVCNLRGLDGLPIKENNGCLQADTPEQFAACINTLLNDDALYNKISRLAVCMFTTYFDKTKRYKALDDQFNI